MKHQPKIVMTFGTFDRFHPGHRHYLSEAKQHGNYLITVIARDETVLRIKGKSPVENEKVRMENVKNAKIADKVVIGSLTNPYDLILLLKPDVLCFGYDQRSFNGEKLQAFLDARHLSPQIVILDAFEPEKWKSSLIK